MNAVTIVQAESREAGAVGSLRQRAPTPFWSGGLLPPFRAISAQGRGGRVPTAPTNVYPQVGYGDDPVAWVMLRWTRGLKAALLAPDTNF